MTRGAPASAALHALFRGRAARAAALVLGLYLALAAVVACGGVSREDVIARVGPGSAAGGLGAPALDARLRATEFYLGHVTDALDARAPAQALRSIDLAGLRVTRDATELGVAIEPLWTEVEGLLERHEGGEPVSADAVAQLERDVAALYTAPTGWPGLRRALALSLGTDRQGRSIALRAVHAILLALQVGLVAALVSVAFGALLGAAAGYAGGWVDTVVMWLVAIVSAVPYIVVLIVLASLFLGSTLEGTLVPVYVAFCATFWVGPCRVIRAEVQRLREEPFVDAARLLGLGHARIVARHVLPNTAHLMLVDAGLLFVAAVKAEVILSFLGLGVKGVPSWGTMIRQSAQEVAGGFLWQIGTATLLLFGLVLAFHVLTDALQDAFRPRRR